MKSLWTRARTIVDKDHQETLKYYFENSEGAVSQTKNHPLLKSLSTRARTIVDKDHETALKFYLENPEWAVPQKKNRTVFQTISFYEISQKY